MIARTLPTVLLTLAGCATPSVLLLPDEGGGQGAVAVLESGGKAQETVIDEGNSRARLGSRVTSRVVTPRASEQGLVNSLPPPPVTFIMYYDEGTTRITPTSRPQFDALLAEVARRSGVEVQISGHTDRKGQDDDNDRLSEVRARSVLEQLAEAGIPREQMVAVGRGERDPRVATADGAEEIANRRVEVVVR